MRLPRKKGRLKQISTGPGRPFFRKVSEKSVPPLATYLGQSSLKSGNDGRLEIEVNGNGFNLNMIRRKKNMDILRAVICEYFGRPVDFVIQPKLKTNETKQKARIEADRLKQEALGHPLVADTLDVFSGKVTDVKILQEVKK